MPPLPATCCGASATAFATKASPAFARRRRNPPPAAAGGATAACGRATSRRSAGGGTTRWSCCPASDSALQALFDHVEEPLPDRVELGARQAAQRPVDHEQGQSVHRGPGEEFGARAALGR